MIRAARPTLRLLALGLLLAAGAGCQLLPPAGDAPLRYRDELPGVSVQVDNGVVYSSAQDGTANELRLDVYRPTPDTVTSRPAVVLVHGGAYRVGGRGVANMVTLANAYAKRGYVAVSIDYRLLGPPEGNCGHGGVDFSVCIRAALAAQHDSQSAVRWLRTNASTYGVDPGRIGIQGASAGATTALLVGVNSGDPGNSGNAGPSSAVQASVPICGAVPPEGKDLFEAVLDPGDAPTLFFYGTQDQVVPLAWVEANSNSMAKLGNGAIREAVEGGHVPFDAKAQELYITQTTYFLYDNLDLAHAAR